MSPDRVVYSFILGWVILIALLIALDWLGNPNRGGFRPKGERPSRNRRERRVARAHHRREDDAAVRATLRDAYGASSLRLAWNAEHEDRVLRVDDALVVGEADEIDDDVVETIGRELVVLDHSAIIGDPLPNIDEAATEPPLPDSESGTEPDPESEAEVAALPAGWKLGTHPLAPTLKGTPPAPATVRTRVWKNHGATGSWDEANLTRLRAGKPPRRTNPMTGRVERATVDVESGSASWGSDPVDPFEPQT